LIPGTTLTIVVGAGGTPTSTLFFGGNGGGGQVAIACVSTGAAPTNDRGIIFWSTGQYASNSNFVYTAAGNVGIGTTSPGTALDVNGGIRAGSASTVTTCDATREGVQRYNYANHAIEWCNGSSWITATSVSGTTPTPTGMGGTGYFVLSSGTLSGNMGGLAGADAFCQNDLTANSWMNKPGALNTTKIFAYLCDNASCRGLLASTNYYYGVSGNSALGGAFFTTDASTFGPHDGYQWNVANRFGISAPAYWTGPRGYGTNSSTDWYWTNTVDTGVVPAWDCNSWTDNSSGNTGVLGTPANTDYTRFTNGGFSYCNVAQNIICVVNP
jgi:hypothetical protein